MEFNKRPKKTTSMVAERKTWRSKCKHYQVMQSHIPFAYDKFKNGKRLGYSDRYYAMYHVGTWEIISKHTKRRAAERACREHEKRHSGDSQRAGPGLGRGNRAGAVHQPRAGGGAAHKRV